MAHSSGYRTRSWAMRFLLVSALAVACAGAQPVRTVLQTSSLRWTVSPKSGPSVLENLLTDERLRIAPGGFGAAVHYASGARRTALSFQRAEKAGSIVDLFYGSGDAASVRVRIAPAPGHGLDLTARARSVQTGVRGVSWSFSFEAAGGNDGPWRIITPACSGLAFDSPPPFRDIEFPWPGMWEAAMVLIQSPQGGFLIRAVDSAFHFKSLRLAWHDGRWTLEFCSENFAPFDALRTANSVTWRIEAYRGDWRAGAGIYRAWMQKALKLKPFAQKQPEWPRDIRFVVITGMDAALLDDLARYVPPPNTLLYVPSWRRDPYDMNYPEYTAAEGFPEFVEAAHRRGFRVMVHVNYFGCDLKHPLYEQFEKFQLRAPGTGKRLWWIPPLERHKEKPRIKFAYIHPGCTAWRRLLVERFSKIVQEYKVDALHLDQTLCIPNHNGGRVDGMTVPEGNLRLHQELRSALPNTALSGEGLDEVTVRFEHFAQRHAVHAVDHTRRSWNNQYIDAAHPVSSFLLLPWCRMYGYLGMASPTYVQLFRAWRRAYAAWGVLPTLARPSRAMLQNPGPDLLVLVREAAFGAAHRLEPDFDAPQSWPDNLLFRLRGADGAILENRRPFPGILDCRIQQNGTPAETLFRYVCGRTEYVGPESAPDWPLFNDRAVIGLDPDLAWLLLPKPRDPRTPHISRLPARVGVARLRLGPDRIVIDLRNLPLLNLVDQAVQARTGTRRDGREAPIERGAAFQPQTAICNEEQRRAIFAHPPWRRPNDAAGPLGETFGQFAVRLPKKPPMVLRFGLGLRDSAGEHSDGVTFIVRIDGREVFRKHHTGKDWEDHEISLAPWAGRNIVLELVTTPGPDDNPSYDWAVWGAPVIIPAGSRNETVTLTAARPPSFVITDGALDATPVKPAPGRTTELNDVPVNVPIPGGAAFLWESPVDVTGPKVNLTELPPTISATAYDRPLRLPARYVSFAPGEGVSGGVARRGIAAHPPDHGRVYGEYFLRLPPGRRIAFKFAVALRDGSRSNGCRFLVEVNRRVFYDRLLTAPDGWHEAALDLSRFAGRCVLLSLIVDSAGSHYYDWARWGDPLLIVEPDRGGLQSKP